MIKRQCCGGLTESCWLYTFLKMKSSMNISLRSRTCMYQGIKNVQCAYQGVRNVSFSKNFAYVLNERSPLRDFFGKLSILLD